MITALALIIIGALIVGGVFFVGFVLYGEELSLAAAMAAMVVLAVLGGTAVLAALFLIGEGILELLQ